MRYWGKNIEIDGSFYDTAFGRQMIPNGAEMIQLRAAGNYYQFEGDANVYEATVQNMMRDIESNDVGKILIDAINRTNTKLRIIPLTGREQTQLRRIPCANRVGNYSASGNESVIWFEPWSRMMNLFTGVGNSPYQVLVHELHHSLRQMRGKLYITGPLGNGAFPNPEELFSVTIENMYLSSVGQPQRMLGSYSQGTSLGARTDRDWYKQYGNELEVWCQELPDVRMQLERLYGGWNPIGVRRGVLDFVITL